MNTHKLHIQFLFVQNFESKVQICWLVRYYPAKLAVNSKLQDWFFCGKLLVIKNVHCTVFKRTTFFRLSFMEKLTNDEQTN